MNFLEDKEDLDHKGVYIYEFYDKMDESLKKRFNVLGDEDNWYPFINDPKEVQRFEIEYQNLLAERQGSFYCLFGTHLYTLELKDKIRKAINKSSNGKNKKEFKKKDEKEMKREEEEEEEEEEEKEKEKERGKIEIEIKQKKKEVDQVIY